MLSRCYVIRLYGLPWLAWFAPALFVSCISHTAAFFPLLCSAVWAAICTALLSLLPQAAARLLGTLANLLVICYALIQAGYFCIFQRFLWLRDLAYLRDGAEFANSVFSYLSVGFLAGAAGLLVLSLLACRLRPRTQPNHFRFVPVCFGALTAAALVSFCAPDNTRYDALGVCKTVGLYQTAAYDISEHFMQPALCQTDAEQARAQVSAYLNTYGSAGASNSMTGKLRGKNVILVLMESADDWTITQDSAPTITRLMQEGIQFTNFYTPLYGSARTFNSEFAMNTGIFSPTDGTLVTSYQTNDFSESLPNQFRTSGYTANAFHYNSPSFYSRGVMDSAMGYEQYISYMDYTNNSFSSELYEDCFVLTNPALQNKLLPTDRPFFNFVISRNAHMPYGNGDSVGTYALQKYPQYANCDSCSEVPYYYAKIRLLDDFFAQLLQELEQRNLLQNTVIIGVTDHYAYTMNDQQRVRELSHVPVDLLVERTPCFIWSADMQPMTVSKPCNTADLAPTLLNLFGMDCAGYLGHDIFDETYAGYAIFSDGSWITSDAVYQSGAVAYTFPNHTITQTEIAAMNTRTSRYLAANNQILSSDYYCR